jgi:hypothetical protein
MMPCRQTRRLTTIILLAALLLLTACSAQATLASNAPSGSFDVLIDGSSFAAIDVSTIDTAEFTASLTKKGGIIEEHAYKATALASLLESAGFTGLDKVTSIVVTAKDGYSATFTFAELQQADNIYVASRIDGQPIIGSDGKQAAQIIVKQDGFSTRWVQDILSINLIKG